MHTIQGALLMHKNIGEMIYSACTRYMNKDFIRSIDEETSITFGKFGVLCDRIGAWISNIGIKKASPVSVIGKNSINNFITGSVSNQSILKLARRNLIKLIHW